MNIYQRIQRQTENKIRKKRFELNKKIMTAFQLARLRAVCGRRRNFLKFSFLCRRRGRVRPARSEVLLALLLAGHAREREIETAWREDII